MVNLNENFEKLFIESSSTISVKKYLMQFINKSWEEYRR